jgi:membrane protein
MLRKGLGDFWNNDCLSMAAALSYSTVFSLPALLILVLTLAGLFVSPTEVQEALQTQLGGIVGPSGQQQIESILTNARRPDIGFGVASALGIVFLIVGATGAFVQLQSSLNRTWKVKPDPRRGGVRNFLMKRVLSFGMILGIAFLLLVSLVISAALSALGGYMGRLLPGIGAGVLELFNNLVSFGVIAVLFAAMFKFLPDAEIDWRDVWVGAGVTTFLFIVGKFLIGLYLGRSDPGQPFGAAASLAILLVWIYYASLILLFGAEFTETWANARGSGVRPETGAVRVVEEEREIR